MKIYYAKYRQAIGLMYTGVTYIEYFNSKEALKSYIDRHSKRKNSDVLEAIGKAKFNELGRLELVKKSEVVMYDDSMGEGEVQESNNDFFDEEDEES